MSTTVVLAPQSEPARARGVVELAWTMSGSNVALAVMLLARPEAVLSYCAVLYQSGRLSWVTAAISWALLVIAAITEVQGGRSSHRQWTRTVADLAVGAASIVLISVAAFGVAPEFLRDAGSLATNSGRAQLLLYAFFVNLCSSISAYYCCPIAASRLASYARVLFDPAKWPD